MTTPERKVNHEGIWEGLPLNTPVFDRPVCAQVTWYLRNVNYMWFLFELRFCQSCCRDLCAAISDPPTHTLSEVLCDYRVQRRRGLTRINKCLRFRERDQCDRAC